MNLRCGCIQVLRALEPESRGTECPAAPWPWEAPALSCAFILHPSLRDMFMKRAPGPRPNSKAVSGWEDGIVRLFKKNEQGGCGMG